MRRDFWKQEADYPYAKKLEQKLHTVNDAKHDFSHLDNQTLAAI